MKKLVILVVLTFAFSATTALAANSFLFFKSPGPGMHFTAGLTVQVWGDLIPRDDAVGWPAVECHWDDQMIGNRVGGNPKGFDYYPFTIPAAQVTAGVHKLRLNGFVRGGGPSRPADVEMPVQIDPWPADKKLVELSDDLTVADLDWTNVAVKGNGHVVKVSGKLTIKSSLVTGLGSIKLDDPATADPAKVVMVPGITGSLSGAVDIEDSIFEATGALHLTITGSESVTIKNNEFRASNFIKYNPSNPEASPVIALTGNNSSPKLFQGNRIGAGIVQFDRMSNWLIGGDTDALSNIMIGPRCVLSMTSCHDMHVIGNYIFHNYRGQWSQGFNLYCQSCENILAEHNVLRASSWPLQTFAGEFRYNLMIDVGHNWVRSLTSGTQFHHNLLVHTGDPFGSGVGAGVWLYDKETNVAIYNNTFDAGNAPEFGAPVIAISTGCSLSTLRNNVFTNIRPIIPIAHNAMIARTKDDPDAADGSRIAYADYNCFFNPAAPNTPSYDPGIAQNKDPGSHDIKANPQFAQGPQIPYAINEDDVWNRKFKVSQVLAQYRQRYAPVAGSPLLGKGDPADGKDSYIGAIGPGKDPKDLFGKFGQIGSEKAKGN